MIAWYADGSLTDEEAGEGVYKPRRKYLQPMGVHYSNEFVNYVLSVKYPNLIISKSKKIRSLIDTPHNIGIFHFLLQVKGPCDFEKIKKSYADNLLDVRDKAGFLKFPKLRQKLEACFGHYAWVKDNSAFNINNHVLLSSSNYRGRPVNDSNIEGFVSELISKYIPSDLPQWQVIVIPTSLSTSISVTGNDATPMENIEDDHYYILIKIHHLIIAEEEDIHISELLMLQQNGRKPIIDIDELNNVPKSQNLSYFIRKPEHIQNLLHHISKAIVNRWNAFIYEFESLETPDGYRRVHITNITQLLSVLLIILVNVCIDYWKTQKARDKKRRRATRTSSGKEDYGRVATFRMLLAKEVDQRNLSLPVAIAAVRNSWHPASLVKTCTKLVWRANINNIVLLPYHIYCELVAMRDLLFKGQTRLTSTHCGRLSVYLPMLLYAQMEFLKICYEIFKAPVNIYEELFVNLSKESNLLQNLTYSGRKIVSFSKSIDAAAIRKRINFSEEVRESDFVLSCMAGAIHDFFEIHNGKAKVPKMLNTTCRSIAKGYFTDNMGNKVDNIGGIVFLQLPMKSPDREHARQLHSIVDNIRRKQIMIYLASMGQTRFDLLTALVPRVFTKICINFFSLNFPVTITEIHGANSEFQTLWGQQVEDVLLFRPPQSKAAISLNIHRFGDKYRLATMVYTQLGPDHLKITRSFENYMESVTLSSS